MQRLNSALYTVSPGETVTLTVQAIKVANFDGYVVEAVPQSPVSNTPRTYRFTVNKPAGANVHSSMSYFFPDDAPDDAEYRVFLAGDQGGGTFNGPVVHKPDGIDHCDFSFRVE
jgi:hypothetical protein